MIRHPSLLLVVTVLACLGSGSANAATGTPPDAPAPAFNHPGNLLIADQRNNRVIEVDPDGRIVWSFGTGPEDLSGKSPIGACSVDRSGDLTLVAACGIPAGVRPDCPEGCRDDRVLLVDRKGKVVWQYGELATPGTGKDRLDRPARARWLSSGNVLIADRGNHRVIEVRRKDKAIVWQHGKTGEPGTGAERLSRPGSAEPIDGGLVLIADGGNDRAIVVDREHHVVATYTAGGTAKDVTAASPAPDTGNVLVVEQGHKRIAELDPSDRAIASLWTYVRQGSVPDPQVACVRRLRNGDTLVCDQMNHRVVRYDATWREAGELGTLARPGFGTKSAAEGLNAPADVDVVGD